MNREGDVIAEAGQAGMDNVRIPLRKRRGLSVAIAAGIIVLGVVLIVLVVNILKSSRNQPINIELYPGAQLVDSKKAAQYDVQIYSTDDSVQKVMDWYAARLPKDDTNGCKKIYTDPQPSEEPGHYRAVCVVDNSLLNVVQRVSITINYQAATGSSDYKTYILVERLWGSS